MQHTPALAVAFSVAISATPFATAQLTSQQFYLLRGDGLLYNGRFGSNTSSLVGDAGLAPNPGSGNGLGGELAFDRHGRLYGLGGTSTNASDIRVAQINTATAQSSTFFDLDAFNSTSITIDTDDRMYVYQTQIPGGSSILTLDTNTGQVLSQVAENADEFFTSWTIRSDGLLVGADLGDGSFHTIDPNTGVVEALGLGFGSTINSFANYDGNSYFMSRQADESLDIYSIDLFSGEFLYELTLTGEHQDGPGNIFGFAIIPAPGSVLVMVTASLGATRRRR